MENPIIYDAYISECGIVSKKTTRMVKLVDYEILERELDILRGVLSQARQALSDDDLIRKDT